MLDIRVRLYVFAIRVRLHSQSVNVHAKCPCTKQITTRHQTGPGRNLLVYPNTETQGIPLDS